MTEPQARQFIAKTPLSEQLGGQSTSALKKYQQKVLGDSNLLSFLQYELSIFLFGQLSGAPGYLLRKLFYPSLFQSVGKGVIFGKGIVLRHPRKISLGSGTAIDDYGLLDASGTGEKGMYIGNDVIISRNCVIQGKTGFVSIGDKTDIGCNTIITSSSGISIGRSVLISGNCYVGGGHYVSDRTDISMIEQGVYSKGTVIIGDDVWLGAGATVLDGVEIGRGCIVGAGAVVTKSVPEFSVVIGVPAKVFKNRKDA